MMTARKAQLTILSLSFAAVAGCGVAGTAGQSPATTGKAAPATTAPARDVLLKAVPDESVGAYRFVVRGGTTPVSGVLDAPAKAVQLDIVHTEPDAGFTMTTRMLLIGERSWLKMSFSPAGLPGLPKLPKKWMLLDPSKIKDRDSLPSGYPGETDPGYTAALVRNSAGLRQTAPGRFAGTTDLTRSADAEIVEPATLTALGDRAKTVPFEAAVDAGGHLTSLTVRVPAAGKARAGTYSVSYTGFGTTASPAVPAAGEQQKAVSAVYELLN